MPTCIDVVTIFSRWLIALYPRAWRERYGEEVAALIDQTHPGGFAAFDLFVGAGREWVRLAATKFTGRHFDRAESWSVARTLLSAFLLVFIFTGIPGTHLSRPFALGRLATLIVVYTAWLLANRSVHLEIVPLDHGVASSS